MSSTLTPGSQGLLIVGFLVFVALCTLLCVVTGTDEDDTAVFHTGNRPLKPWQSGVAIGRRREPRQVPGGRRVPGLTKLTGRMTQ